MTTLGYSITELPFPSPAISNLEKNDNPSIPSTRGELRKESPVSQRMPSSVEGYLFSRHTKRLARSEAALSPSSGFDRHFRRHICSQGEFRASLRETPQQQVTDQYHEAVLSGRK
jgi:hypothetical protein